MIRLSRVPLQIPSYRSCAPSPLCPLLAECESALCFFRGRNQFLRDSVSTGISGRDKKKTNISLVFSVRPNRPYGEWLAGRLTGGAFCLSFDFARATQLAQARFSIFLALFLRVWQRDSPYFISTLITKPFVIIVVAIVLILVMTRGLQDVY